MLQLLLTKVARAGGGSVVRGGRRAKMSLCLVAAAASIAARPPAEKAIELTVGASQTLRPPGVAERVVMGEPQVCDVTSLPSGALLLTAKQAGETQITVTSRDGSTTAYRVIASVPTLALQQALREAFPQEEDLQARSTGGAVYLAGTVSDSVVAEAAGRIAQSLFASSGRKVGEIVNLLQVAAPQQVQVHLRFVEIQRKNMRSIGFNAWANDQNYAGAMFGPNSPQHYCLSCDSNRFVGPANPPLPAGTVGGPMANLPMLVAPIAGSFGVGFATNQGPIPFTATLALLEGRGIAKTLSEPTLVAISGQEAKFLVGGEFPIPIPDSLGRVLIQFKSYGAQLAFTPTVLTQDTVTLKLDSVVSDIDRANGVTLQTASVPALSSRQSTTTVRLRDGQSFAVAGLLSDVSSSTQQKWPLLGELPIIGVLFRNTEQTRRESELMVVVTVNLVRPLESQQLPASFSPDEFTDPGDVELFLLGTLEKTKKRRDPAVPNTAKRGPARAMNSPDGLVGFSR